MSPRQRTTPTPTGVTLGDLGPALVPLARNIASTALPVLRAKNPVFLSWAVTEACNLACAHCSMNRPLPDELDRAQRMAIARKLAASDAWGVSLIGGEPLLVDGVFELARTLKAGGKRVFIGTSGDRLGRHVSAVLDAGIDVVTLSVDAAEAAKHDAFRGRAGLFDRVEKAADELRARRTGEGPRVQVRCTINRHNYRDLDAFIDHWSQHADNVLLQIIQDNGLHQVRDRSCLFRPEDRDDFERVYADLRARHAFLAGRYYDLLPRYVFEREALQRDIGFRCLLVPATTAVVEANGAVKLCHGRADSHIGSLVDSELDDLWRAHRAAEARDNMQSRDYGCMCWESSYARNLDLVEMSRLYDSFTGRVGALLGRRS